MTHPPDSKITKSDIPGFILERTAKRMKQACAQALRKAKVDMTVDQWVILQELDKEDGLNQNELAERSFKHAPTVTRIVDTLTEKGLLERQPDPNDRRRYNIRLTSTGQLEIKRILPIIKDFREQCWEGMSEEDLKKMMNLLNQIFDNLK